MGMAGHTWGWPPTPGDGHSHVGTAETTWGWRSRSLGWPLTPGDGRPEAGRGRPHLGMAAKTWGWGKIVCPCGPLNTYSHWRTRLNTSHRCLRACRAVCCVRRWARHRQDGDDDDNANGDETNRRGLNERPAVAEVPSGGFRCSARAGRTPAIISCAFGALAPLMTPTHLRASESTAAYRRARAARVVLSSSASAS